MEESKAASFEAAAGTRLSTTFLLLSPPVPKEADGSTAGMQAVPAFLTKHHTLSPVDTTNNMLPSFPDDEILEEDPSQHGGPEDGGRGASIDGIGRVSSSGGSSKDRRPSGANSGAVVRQELSPIPFSTRGSGAHQLPLSSESEFVVWDEDPQGHGREEEEMRPAAEVRQEVLSVPEMTPTSPQMRESEGGGEDDDQRDDVNDSAVSKEEEGSVASHRSSVGELEMERMTEELGASSMEFIRRIRAAAFRRKLDVTRSRDSLAAKERERQLALADAQQKAKDRGRQSEPTAPLHTIDSAPSVAASPSRLKSLFHARPLPKTTGPKGSGGLSGVPNVVKKPTTIPQSPLLGSRRGRQQHRRSVDEEVPPQPTLDDDSDSSRSPSPTRDQNIFRALPMPKSSTNSGNAGMTGVPKVPKRPSTVPQSPVLGLRRRPERDTAQESRVAARAGAATKGIPTVQKRPTTVPRSPLLGLRRFAKQLTKEASAPIAADAATPGPSESQQWTRRSASSSLSTSTSVTPLVGLHLVESGSQIEVPAPSSLNRDRTGSHDVKSAEPAITSRPSGEEYRPHSTARAAERAQFQAKKAELEKQRQETLSRLRRQQVKELKREMQALRSSLT